MRPRYGLAIVALCACSAPPREQPIGARPAEVVARWSIKDRDKPIGVLIKFEVDDPAGPVQFYRVENLAEQWVGFIDMDGRVWRREPFADHAGDFIGIHPMVDGLALLFDVDQKTRVQVDEVDGDVGLVNAADRGENKR